MRIFLRTAIRTEFAMSPAQLDPKMYPPLEPKFDDNGMMIFPEPEPLSNFGEVLITCYASAFAAPKETFSIAMMA
jgi:hypothetical protein